MGELLSAPRRKRVSALRSANIARAQEVEAKLLAASRDVDKRFGGDLRRMRGAADRKPEAERTLLLRLKGVRDVCERGRGHQR